MRFGRWRICRTITGRILKVLRATEFRLAVIVRRRSERGAFPTGVQAATNATSTICVGSRRVSSIHRAVAAILRRRLEELGSNVVPGASDGPPHPLTAPAVRPCTMYRLANANNTIVGMIVSTAAADIDPQSML